MPAGAGRIPAISRLTGTPVMMHPADVLISDKKAGPGFPGPFKIEGRGKNKSPHLAGLLLRPQTPNDLRMISEPESVKDEVNNEFCKFLRKFR